MRTEFQIKAHISTITEKDLLNIGFEPLGCVQQKDIYIVSGPEKCLRVRVEGEKHLICRKGRDRGQMIRTRAIEEREVHKRKAARLLRKRGIQVEVFKTSCVYRKGNIVVTLDDVEYLGKYIEVRADDEEGLWEGAAILNIPRHQFITKTYPELMVERKVHWFIQKVLHFHERIGEAAFGITSGILTTLGVLVGMAYATQDSKIAVIGAIAVLAGSDSWSDAAGMYHSKLAERGTSKKDAIRFAFGTMVAKVVLPLLFCVPVAIWGVQAGGSIAVAIGAILFMVFRVENAVVMEEDIRHSILEGMCLMFAVLWCSLWIGKLISEVM